MNQAYSITAAELAARGRDGIPPELLSSAHLIYSSPATLAFNSPGAQGFGVKRAGLAVPGSVMLLVAPACCGRNTAALGCEASLAERFFYLMQDETDIVTGRHLARIPEAVKEVCPDTSSKATLWIKAQQEGALTPPCISEKPAGSTHITKSQITQLDF